MNENYSCVEILWKVSDHLASSQKGNDYSELWESIFRKLYVCCSDSNSQVRHSSLKIYSSLLSNYGHIFDKKLWLLAFRDLFFTLFDEVFEVFLNLTLNQKGGTDIDVPEFVQDLKSEFNKKLIKE